MNVDVLYCNRYLSLDFLFMNKVLSPCLGVQFFHLHCAQGAGKDHLAHQLQCPALAHNSSAAAMASQV